MNDNAYILSCGHTYCRACILEARQHKSTCPTCRADVMDLPIVRNTIVSDVKDQIDSMRRDTEKQLADRADSILTSCREYVAHIQHDWERRQMDLLMCKRGDHRNPKKRTRAEYEGGYPPPMRRIKQSRV